MFVVVVAILLFCWHDYFQGVTKYCSGRRNRSVQKPKRRRKTTKHGEIRRITYTV